MRVVRVCMRACVCACVHEFVCMCLCVLCVCVCVCLSQLPPAVLQCAIDALCACYDAFWVIHNSRACTYFPHVTIYNDNTAQRT